jgi:hypothetical protein
MLQKISNFFKDLLDASPRNAHVPPTSTPPSALPTENPERLEHDQSYQEATAEIESIAGTSINFGTSDEMVTDAAGNVRYVKRKVAQIVGTGILVMHLEPTVKDGIALPGVGGRCSKCIEEGRSRAPFAL